MRPAALIISAGIMLALLLTGAPAEASSPGTYYLVRADLRLCPSPLCGGAWVRRVNHATTRCADGVLRSECYVATVGTGRTGTGDLVLGTIVPAQIAGFPKLGKLAVRRAWSQAAEPAPPAPVFRVVDTGIRCVVAPCFSYRATRLETERSVALSELDLRPLDMPPATVARALRQLTRGGLFVSGAISTVPRAGPAGNGRVLAATQAWLPLTP